MYPYGPAQDFLITARLHALRHEAAEARLRRQARAARGPHPFARLIAHLGRLPHHRTPMPSPAHAARTSAAPAQTTEMTADARIG